MNRNLWIDYLRTFVTVLVVAHHAALAYTTFAYFDTAAYIRSSSPVVDASRWVGLDIFVNFNDIFFMSLMFFISGLFVFKSIVKKGRKQFLRDRIIRLGLPFAIAVTLIIPIAYIPSYHLVHGNFSLIPFVTDYLTNQQWPVGPPWFIWVLLLFNIMVTMLPDTFYSAAPCLLLRPARKPFVFFMRIFLIAALAYIPLSFWIGAYAWTGFGPFDFQLNRILLYLVFFLLGTFLGSTNWEKHLFTNNRLLNKSLLFWTVLAGIAFISVELLIYFGQQISEIVHITEGMGVFIFMSLFILSCVCSSFAFIAVFKQKAINQNRIWDSLSANAYGIYILHYVFITWLQFALLKAELPAVVKFLLVFAGTLLLSWMTVKFIRRSKAVEKLL